MAAIQGICEDVFRPDGCEVFVFMSMVTDIYLPSSNIDLVVKVDVGGVDKDYDAFFWAARGAMGCVSSSESSLEEDSLESLE